MLEVANSPWRGAITPIVEEDAAAHEKEGRTDLTLVAEAMRRAGQRVISSTSAASRLTVPAYRRTGQQTTNLGVRSSNLSGAPVQSSAYRPSPFEQPKLKRFFKRFLIHE